MVPDKEEQALRKRAEESADQRIKEGTLRPSERDGYIRGYCRKCSKN